METSNEQIKEILKDILIVMKDLVATYEKRMDELKQEILDFKHCK